MALITTSLYLFTSSAPAIKKSAQYIATNYLKELKLDWSKLNIEVKDSFSSKRVYQINYNDGCIQYPNILICIEKLSLRLELNILNPLSSRITELIVHSSQIKVRSSEDTQADEPLALNIKETLEGIHGYYSKFKIYFPKEIDLKLKDVILATSKSNTRIKLSLNKRSLSLDVKTDQQQINIQLDKSQDSYLGDMSLNSPDINLVTKIDLSLDKSFQVKTKTKIKINSLRSHPLFNIDLSLNEKESSINIHEGSFNYQGISLKTNTCNMQIDYSSSSDYLNFICENILLDVKKKLRLKTKIAIEILNDINFAQDQLLGSALIKSKNINQKDFSLTLDALINIKTLDQKLSVLYDKFSWQLKSQKFNKLVEKLEGTAFAIPAPINTMKGEILLSSKQIFKMNENNIIVPLLADISIDDKTKNRIKLNFNGELFYSNDKGKKPKFTGELFLDDVRVNIPRIDPIGGIPSLTSSSRINKEIKIVKKKKKTNFLYNLKIKSKSDETIKIYYYLFDPYFSFGVRAHATNDFVTYKVYSNNKMKIKYLKREVEFDKLVVSSKKDDKANLNTTFNYYASGYKLILNVIGTVDSPKLILKSYPSLPREDIISLLIYNRKATSISSVQKQSVGGTQAAIADKALSLFSIWAFASTPIDYVSYNPASKSYSASISLPGNTSFQIGTDWESINNLTLRKQLSDTWAIETSYNPNEENAKQNVMLQKEINF